MVALKFASNAHKYFFDENPQLVNPITSQRACKRLTILTNSPDYILILLSNAPPTNLRRNESQNSDMRQTVDLGLDLGNFFWW
jgi:hypothetical protein